MKISVIVPCLNAAHTIAQQLDALAHQSVQPWEVIVADNGSTDQTQEIVRQYTEKFTQLRLIDASHRQGASHARNAGAIAATGDYLAFCDADDVVSKDWISAFQTAFAEHNFLASRFDYQLLNPGASNANQDTGLQNFRIPFLPFSGGCGLGIQRSLHESISGFDESILYCEDIDYCLKLQLAGETLTFVPEALVHIRYTADQDTSFWGTRKTCFRHAYNWGAGMAKLYGRYRDRGMMLHGILPRLVLLPLWMVRFVVSGFDYQSLDRIGWHVGAVHELLKLHLRNIDGLRDLRLWLSVASEN
jgi:glycosyltransferase involved in cell wall biosynthesis